MTYFLTLARLFLGTRTLVTASLLIASCFVILTMTFCQGSEAERTKTSTAYREHHFQTLEDVNDAVDALGHPTGDDLRCLLTKRGEIRDFDNLLCP